MDNPDAIDEAALKALGSRGLLRLQGGGLQVIVGPIADAVVDDIRAVLSATGEAPVQPAEPPSPNSVAPPSTAIAPITPQRRQAWQQALGGERNVRSAAAVASTRLRLELTNASMLDERALTSLGAHGVQRLERGVIHVILDEQAKAVALGLSSH